MKANLLGSYLVQAESHTSLNSSRGFVNTDSLDETLDEEIQFALAEQFVSKAYRLIGKRDNKPFTLRTFFLTFEVPSLPASIHVGYGRVPVSPYIPNPMRCHQCQKFGHTQQRCASNLVCGHCGENGYGEEPCPNPPHCVNCSRAHASADRRCPVFLDERAIQELRVKDGLFWMPERSSLKTNPRLDSV
jgi:hypothetical protein